MTNSQKGPAGQMACRRGSVSAAVIDDDDDDVTVLTLPQLSSLFQLANIVLKIIALYSGEGGVVMYMLTRRIRMRTVFLESQLATCLRSF